MRLLRPSLSLAPALLLFAALATHRGSAQDIFVTPVANAPFSAVVNIQNSHLQPDGSVLALKSMRQIARDVHGRIHNESRALTPASDASTAPLIRIHLYDPQTRISTYLNPRKKTFWTETVNHPPSTVPPTIRYAAPGDGVPQNDFAKQEDLGVREMDGLSVRGVRETQTIPADDTGKEIVITDEFWYSEDLRINLMIRHSDPRTGSVTMTVSQVSRTEPDPALFQIPDDYQTAKAARN
jgi:hypothetical protein